MRQSLLRAVVVGLVMTALAACATGPTVTPAQMADIRVGTQSAIIMSYDQHEGMYGAHVAFVNLDTLGIHRVSMHGGDNWVNAGPDMVAVPPGRYRVLNGGLYSYDYSSTLPLLSAWFDAFEVGPGEVVDVGTLNVDTVDLRSMPNGADQIFNTLVWLDPARRDRFMAYRIDDSHADRVAAMLASKYPDLGVTPVRRPLKVMLERDAFEDIVRAAYAPDADGGAPDSRIAEERLATAVTEYVVSRNQAAD